jgi:CBS domain-containing protein
MAAKKDEIRDVMTPAPTALPGATTVMQAALLMREQNIGDVLVTDGQQLLGVITDRDIVIRCVAAGLDPSMSTLQGMCSQDVVSVGPQDKVDDVVDLMRRRAIRRVPVLDGGTPIGIVSLGDLAQQRDPKSALAAVSSAPPNQ